MSNPIILSIDPKLLRTDERIIHAAIKVFADFSLEKATLAIIAKEAGITLSSITYYFKTKEKLYGEVLNRILDYMLDDINRRIAELDAMSENALTPEVAEINLRDLFRHFVGRLFDSGSALFVRILIREQSAPSVFYNDIYERYFKRVIHLLERLIGVITGCKEKHRLSMLAFSAFAQIIGSRLEKYLLLKHSGIEEFSADDIEQIEMIITENAMLIVKQEHFLYTVT
ncbi:MAG: CerR family C-terminal domain-containing protein [Planctomycetaceae bacterium]|jgi:AcrR family transcriptional regulator|nr:CerR family C-terminal domain-containing protein [Planctomycetaceae bacterium]